VTKLERRRLYVVAALIERQGKVLLAQRRADQSLPLTWEFPGGKIEAGESPEAALVREIHEELGCRACVGELVETIHHAYPDFDLVMPVYRVVVADGEPQPVTVAGIRWVPYAELTNLPMPPADLPFAAKLAARACP
jgi:8-oxo-dGTP diphosphatase